MQTTNGSPKFEPANCAAENVRFTPEAAQECGPECDDGGGSQWAQAAPIQSGEPNRLVKKIKLLNRFVDETLVGLDPSTALLWVVLYREARNGIAEISHGQLAKIMGVSDRTICRHIDVLIANKLLRKLKTGGYGRGCNKYQLGISSLPKDNPLRTLPRLSAAPSNGNSNKPKAARPEAAQIPKSPPEQSESPPGSLMGRLGQDCREGDQVEV